MSDAAATFGGEGRTTITDAQELLSVDAQRAHVLEHLPEPDPIELKLADSLGLVLAEDVVSDEPIPAFANSAMDGYAVVREDHLDATGETPTRAAVLGTVPAGASEPTPIGSGEAVRIMTGAPLPPGADAIVPVEVTREQGGTVEVFRAPRAGEFVRTVGQDVQAGQGLLAAGHRIRPADIGLLAAVGAGRVHCYPTPRVVIFSTGDELVPAAQRPGPGQLRDANGPMLAAMVRQAGAIPYSAGIVGDDRKALMHAFDSNIGHADMFLTSGGVSAGMFDLVRDVVGTLGTVWAHKVAMKPGMPQVFGMLGDVPVFGLPGNPVSSFVSFEVFVRPAIRTIQGRRDTLRPAVRARVTEAIDAPADKRTFVRVRLRREGATWTATPTGDQGSHVLTSVVRADGLAEVPEDTTRVSEGDKLTVHLLVDS
ncbi:MAG: molybdopterin molybdotransferase MoeA [Nitriliruptorales bacterium]|nr:molybdopterin molybdotransferase MoeA [Nitriliruptorales bacterium]